MTQFLREPTSARRATEPASFRGPNWKRAELLSLLSASGTLAGLCITVVAVMNTFDKSGSAVTIIDDLLAGCAAGFVACIYLIFWALRSPNSAMFSNLVRVVDGVFLLALGCMTGAGFLMVYTMW
jgi:hypothetical protein